MSVYPCTLPKAAIVPTLHESIMHISLDRGLLVEIKPPRTHFAGGCVHCIKLALHTTRILSPHPNGQAAASNGQNVSCSCSVKQA